MSTNIPSDYAEVVRSTRLAKGWTQAELAKRLAVTNVTISRWEKGRVEPSASLWEKFLEFVEAIRTAGGGYSKDCANLVRFLAYSGVRIGEAKPALLRMAA